MQLQNGRPTDTTGRLDKEIRTYDFLDKLGIEYQRIDHEADVYKRQVPDILTGKLFRVLFHVIKEIRNIVFVAVNGTLFKVTDF